MNVRPRLLMYSLVTTKAGMSSKTRPPTHYETLEVNPRSTQSEIKSAYFKLSKQYHPDKNSSEEATAKFRDITDAYEVLASYQSRRVYDRSIITRTRFNVPHGDGKQPDPKIKYYQSQAAVFRTDSKSGSTPGYDFNAWTRAHYGRTLNRTLRNKADGAQKREFRKNFYNQKSDKDIAMAVFAAIFMGAIIIVSIENPMKSIDVSTLNQQKELDDGNPSDTETTGPLVD